MEVADQIFDWFKIHWVKVLNSLETTNIYLSMEKVCMMLTYSSVREVDELTSIYEEKDFRLVLHAQYSLKSESAYRYFFMGLFLFSKEQLVIETGTLTSRKVICLADVNVNNEEFKALRLPCQDWLWLCIVIYQEMETYLLEKMIEKT